MAKAKVQKGSKRSNSTSARNANELAGAIADQHTATNIAYLRATLKTEKDGRIFAIAMLQACEAEFGAEVHNGVGPAYHAAAEGQPDAAGVVGIFRTDPQSPTLARWIGRLYRYGTDEAIRGFYVIFTDFIGTVVACGSPDPAVYARDEAEGRFGAWGSVAYSDPMVASAALANGKTEYTARG